MGPTNTFRIGNCLIQPADFSIHFDNGCIQALQPKYMEVLVYLALHYPRVIPRKELIDKIVSSGGKQRMPIREYYPNEKPFKMCYVEDPFGIVFEIYTHSYELTYSSGAYQD